MPLWGSRAPTSKPVAEKTSIHWLQVVAACMCRCIAGMVGCRNRFSYEFDCFCLYRFPQGFGTRGRLWANRRLVTHICCQWRHCIVAILVDRYIVQVSTAMFDRPIARSLRYASTSRTAPEGRISGMVLSWLFLECC